MNREWLETRIKECEQQEQKLIAALNQNRGRLATLREALEALEAEGKPVPAKDANGVPESLVARM